jgi:Outer membrane lipoprotein-sorting protein
MNANASLIPPAAPTPLLTRRLLQMLLLAALGLPALTALAMGRTARWLVLAARGWPSLAVAPAVQGLLLAALSLATLVAAPAGPLWAAVAPAAPSAREIMQRVNDRDDGDNQISDLEMQLVDRNGATRTRTLRAYRKHRGEDSLQLMFFLSPADVQGTGFLTYDYSRPGKDDDQWLYLPALRKTKRIASSDKSGSFVGSDFNYYDLTEPDLDDYDYELMKEVEINGAKTWQIKVTPRSAAVVESTGYTQSIVWVRQDNFVLVRALRWVQAGNELKYFQVNKLERIEGVWVATEMQMVTKAGRDTLHSTVVRFHNVRFNQPMDENFFSVRQLEKGN